MIILSLKITFAQEPSEEILSAFREMDTETQKEVGCHKYTSSIDVNNPKTIHITEIWESKETLAPHFQTDHIAKFQKALSTVEVVGYEAKSYNGAEEVPFESLRS